MNIYTHTYFCFICFTQMEWYYTHLCASYIFHSIMQTGNLLALTNFTHSSLERKHKQNKTELFPCCHRTIGGNIIKGFLLVIFPKQRKSIPRNNWCCYWLWKLLNETFLDSKQNSKNRSLFWPGTLYTCDILTSLGEKTQVIVLK